MDEDGYMSIDPSRRDLPLPAIQGKKDAPRNPLLWIILFGISTVVNVVLAVLLIVLISPASQKVGLPNLSSNSTHSCISNCIPCHAAKDSERANLTLDPNTAHPQLYVSSNLKGVIWKDVRQPVATSPVRYDFVGSVVSNQSFNSGKLCWEVEVVEGGEWWGVGIVKESSNRNGPFHFNSRGGYWGIQQYKGQYQAITNPRMNLTLCHPPKRIRVSLDYSQGLLAFFDGETNIQIFAFQKQNFNKEKIHPWFLIWKGQLLLHP